MKFEITFMSIQKTVAQHKLFAVHDKKINILLAIITNGLIRVSHEYIGCEVRSKKLERSMFYRNSFHKNYFYIYKSSRFLQYVIKTRYIYQNSTKCKYKYFNLLSYVN